jgi:hypothetical protein
MSTPAGWYDDGSGRLRWWDGDQWTDHFADQQQAETETLANDSLWSKAKDVGGAAKRVAGIGATAKLTEGEVAAADEAALYEVRSHIDKAKNATVRLYSDRLEWERGRGVSAAKLIAGFSTMGASLLGTGVKGGKDGYEMLLLNQITSVSNRKDGMMYHLVEVQTAGGTLGFRVSREDAASFRQAILNQMQVRAATPVAIQVAAAPVVEPVRVTAAPDHVAQLQQLAQLRDAGVLTDDEFAAKKQEILARI